MCCDDCTIIEAPVLATRNFMIVLLCMLGRWQTCACKNIGCGCSHVVAYVVAYVPVGFISAGLVQVLSYDITNRSSMLGGLASCMSFGSIREANVV